MTKGKMPELVKVMNRKFKKYKDSYGNYKFVGAKATYRIKPQALGIRIEQLLILSDGTKYWKNTKRDPIYYKNIDIENFVESTRKLIASIEA